MSVWSRIRPQLNWTIVRNSFYLYCGSYLFVKHVGELIICKGSSMVPSLYDGDIVIGEKLSVKRGDLKAGDVVCSVNPADSHQLLCKRIVHGPTEVIEYPQEYEFPLKRVPLGHCFLVGDNQTSMDFSKDSRIMGPVPLGLVQVRLTYRLWPLSRAGWISNYAYKHNNYKDYDEPTL
ncbi:Signal peptidase I [Aphelenchoides besseyi]|nr:Signal peptidase I [Aphelenchoides besseyi]KAI6229565.1 Signal peptidase I [Aphelenchoides besseyi]